MSKHTIVIDMRGRHHLVQKDKPYCPECRAIMDGVTGGGERLPDNGDLSLCLYCGSVNRFLVTTGHQYSLVKLTEADLNELPAPVKTSLVEMGKAFLEMALRAPANKGGEGRAS